MDTRRIQIPSRLFPAGAAILGPSLPSSLRAFVCCLALALVTSTSGCGGDRGPYRPWVHKVYFHGVKQLKESDVRKKIQVKQTSWYSFRKKRLDHPYVAEVDRERIERYYQTRGYFQTHVPKAEVTPYKIDPKQDPQSPTAVQAVDVHYYVEEGPPTKVTEIKIEGLDPDLSRKDADWVKKGTPLHVGETYEHEPYLDMKARLVLRLRQRGYAFANLDSADVAVNRDDQTARVHLVMKPGKKVTLGQVIVRGTNKVDPEVLRKHAGVITGDTYSLELMDLIQGRIFNTGLFSNVRVEPVQTVKDDVADVAITVTEGKHRELRLGVGFGIEPLRNDIHLEAVYTQRRFLGGLRQLQLTLSPGYAAVPAVWADPIRRHGPILDGKVEFTQPDLLGAGSSLTTSIAYELGVQYAYQYHGPTYRLALRKGFWRDRFQLSLSYNFQFLDFFAVEAGLSDESENGMGMGTQNALLFGFTDPYRLGYLQETLSLDLRNRPVNTKRGGYFLLAAEQGGSYFGGAFSYQKLQPEARGYFSIGNRVTVAARVQFGQMWAQGELGSPITQRFYLGGPNSHRGFSYNRLSYQMCSGSLNISGNPTPVLLSCRDQQATNLDDPQRLPTGGDQMLLGQLELRIGLFQLARNWLSFAAFTDVGDVTPPPRLCSITGCPGGSDFGNIDVRRMHIAVGGGLRYQTVVGTIRADLGVRLNRLDSSDFVDGVEVENPDPGQRFAFHISIGESF